MSTEVKYLLSDPNKGRSRAQGILCFLFRDVLVRQSVNWFVWNKCTRLYFNKPHNAENPDRGNLNKDLVKDDFTWGRFKKSVDFLNPITATLTVKLTWHSGRISEYDIAIDPAEDETDPELNEFYAENTPEVFEGRQSPNSTLARLFRTIIESENITLPRWRALLSEYVQNLWFGDETSSTDITNAISSLQRDLNKPRMTWNVLQKGIILLKPKRVEFILTMRWSKQDKDVSYHSYAKTYYHDDDGH